MDDASPLTFKQSAALALADAKLQRALQNVKRGFIINIASEAGLLVWVGMGAYAVSKNALRVLTQLIQDENQDYGIKAWAICPGSVPASLAVARASFWSWFDAACFSFQSASSGCWNGRFEPTVMSPARLFNP